MAESRLTILIADDWPDAAESLGRVLQSHGHLVHLARDGIEAVEKAKEIKPDVLILDVSMPKMSGLDAAKAISRTSGKKPLMIAMSGFCTAEDKLKAYTAGFDLFLGKPADSRTVLEFLEEGDWDLFDPL